MIGDMFNKIILKDYFILKTDFFKFETMLFHIKPVV